MHKNVVKLWSDTDTQQDGQYMFDQIIAARLREAPRRGHRLKDGRQCTPRWLEHDRERLMATASRSYTIRSSVGATETENDNKPRHGDREAAYLPQARDKARRSAKRKDKRESWSMREDTRKTSKGRFICFCRHTTEWKHNDSRIVLRQQSCSGLL